MKRSREIILWAFFLAICFWAGYLKGFLPLTLKQGLFIKGPVRIYNAAPFDLPKNFIAALEEELSQKVEVQRIRNWDELQAKLVTKNGAHLLFAPAQWGEDLTRETLIVGQSYLQPKIEKYIDPDFIHPQGQSLQVLPLYWTVTDFRVSDSSFSGENLQQVLQDKNLSEVYLFPDEDLAVTHLKSWNLKIKDIDHYDLRKTPPEAGKNNLWEVPHSIKLSGTRLLATNNSQALMIYGMMIPKNSPNRRISYKVLEKLMDPSLQQIALSILPLGSTLKDPENELQIEKDQRSSELRNLNLHELILLKQRDLKGYQELQQRYNFSF